MREASEGHFCVPLEPQRQQLFSLQAKISQGAKSCEKGLSCDGASVVARKLGLPRTDMTEAFAKIFDFHISKFQWNQTNGSVVRNVLGLTGPQTKHRVGVAI
eukprot:Pompholyxophrys_punicea_v1_NODE_59_length_4107_cov_22.914878.p3 type:complete len:102 gc:universal NODE_59_length_4107_cov_22.914878:569-874(+)